MGNFGSRILFVSHTSETTGPVHSLTAMLSYFKHRYQVSVLTPEDGPLCEWLEREGIPVHRIPNQAKQGINQMAGLIRKEKTDLVYGNSPNTYARNALIAARLAGRPFIWHFRSVKWHWGWKEGLFLRWADQVVAVSRACAEPLTRFIPAEKIHIIYNGVEIAQFRQDRREARLSLLDEFKLPADTRILVSVGHIMPRKNQLDQVELMRQLASSQHNVHLFMTGNLTRSPEYVDRVRKQIVQDGVEGCIHVLGLRKDIPRLLAAADVFVHTPREDAHPRAVIEAMAAGLPVVSFSIGGVCETVVDGQTGYLIELSDHASMRRAIESILISPHLLRELGEQAQKRVQQRFTAGSTARQIDQLLQEVLKGK